MERRRRAEIALTIEQKRVLWHLKTRGPMPRTQLATELDMHNAALTRLSRELMMLGCLEEQEGQQTGRGRPTVPLAISGRLGYAAGAMAHPGWLEIVLVDFSGAVIAKHAESFNSPDPREFIERVDECLRRLALENNVMRSRLLGLGVAIPGPTTVTSPHKRWTVKWLEGWREVEHPQFFEAVLGIPVWVENEAKLAGLADFYGCGLLERYSSAISIFIGHGVGGSTITTRDVLRGEFGNAGDLGRLYPDLEKPRPSGIDLVRDLKAAGASLASLRDVEQVLVSHAPVIQRWVERAGPQLATLVAAGAAWLDPGAIIVSGSVPIPILSALGAQLEAAQWIFGHTPMPRPTFHVSSLGSWATPIGAAMLPLHEIIAQ